MKTLTAREKTAAQKSFELIDVDNSGALDEEELRGAFKALGLKMTAKEVHHVFKTVDIDCDGTLDMDEFYVCIAQCKSNAKHASALAKLGNATNSIVAREALYNKRQKVKEEKLKEQEAAAPRHDFELRRVKVSSAQLRRLKSQFELMM